MKSLIKTYDRHLKRLAAVPGVQRPGVIRWVVLPWLVGVVAISVALEMAGLPPGPSALIIVPVACVALVGAIYAGARVVRYGWRFDRTPTDLALMQAPGAEVLVRALERVTLSGLSQLTLSTRLRADLKLTSADLSQLLSILSAEGHLDGWNLEDVTSADPTVEALLGKMSQV